MIAGLCASAILAVGASAQAGLVTVRDNPNNGGSVFATGLGRTISIESDGQTRNVGAGIFSLQYGSQLDGWTDFLTFCLQLHETLSLPKDHERIDGETYFDAADNELVGILYGNLMTDEFALRDATSAAGLQAILWEITAETSSTFDLSGGSFQLLTASVLTRANELFQLAINSQFAPNNFDVFRMSGTQDLLVNEVPVPGAIPLLFSGLAGLGFVSRRKRGAA